MLAQSTVTIPNGTATSEVVDLGSHGSRRNLVLGLIPPATLSQTIHLDVSADGTTYARYQHIPGTDLALVAARAIILPDFPFRYLKIVTAAGNEGAARVFQITANVKN